MKKQKGFILPIIIIIVAVAVLGTAGYLVYKSEVLNPKSETNSNIQNSNPETAGWKTYTNTQYGFEFQYPAVGTSTLSNDIIVVAIKNLPIAETGMHTNIDEKFLRVVVKDKGSDSVCPDFNYYSQKNNVIINGIQFIEGKGGEGAMGHGYVYIDYTTLKNNKCVTIDFVISSFNDLQIPTYNGGQPYTVYDLSKETPLIDQIISTFKFTK